MANLLIVEDDVLTNESVCEYLQDMGHIVFSAYDGEQALELFNSKEIDLVVLDIMLPQINGLNVLKKIRQASSIPILMLTAMDDMDTQIMSFDNLADDYVTKPFSIVLLGKRITALLRRIGKTGPANIWSYKDIIVDFSGFSAEKAGKLIDISPKEVQLLKILVDNTGVVLTRDQILDSICGTDVPLNDSTIDTYIGRLRKKLGLDCIVTVKGIGYKFEDVR